MANEQLLMQQLGRVQRVAPGKRRLFLHIHMDVKEQEGTRSKDGKFWDELPPTASNEEVARRLDALVGTVAQALGHSV